MKVGVSHVTSGLAYFFPAMVPCIRHDPLLVLKVADFDVKASLSNKIAKTKKLVSESACLRIPRCHNDAFTAWKPSHC